jgi:hypothetical protein
MAGVGLWGKFFVKQRGKKKKGKGKKKGEEGEKRRGFIRYDSLE